MRVDAFDLSPPLDLSLERAVPGSYYLILPVTETSRTLPYTIIKPTHRRDGRYVDWSQTDGREWRKDASSVTRVLRNKAGSARRIANKGRTRHHLVQVCTGVTRSSWFTVCISVPWYGHAHLSNIILTSYETIDDRVCWHLQA